jgi:hypothetical protein
MSLKISPPYNKEERQQSAMRQPNAEVGDPGPAKDPLEDFVPF